MSCPTGKVEHLTVTAAQAHADSIFRKDGHQPNVYVCSQCGFFHVGGGRASDRPVHRPAPIITTSRPAFVQKKIDKGRTIPLEQAIIEQLRNTLKTCSQIANEFGSTRWLVNKLRRREGIGTQRQRVKVLVAAELKKNPRERKAKLALRLHLPYNTIANVARSLSISQLRPKGPECRLYGRRLNLTHRAKIAAGLWNKGKKNPKHAERMRQRWQDPLLRSRMSQNPPSNKGIERTEEWRRRNSIGVRTSWAFRKGLAEPWPRPI
jgi:hypothetical protein